MSELSRPVRVCYYLQTHTRPAQVNRLVELIKAGSPDSVVLISHDASRPPLDVARLRAMPGVHVFTEEGRYGDFSHVDRYFAAVDWLDANGIEFDWLENISGQDFPLRPIAEIEQTLAQTSADGFMFYAPVFPELTPDGADAGAGQDLVPVQERRSGPVWDWDKTALELSADRAVSSQGHWVLRPWR